jgi:hypothetical protein
LELLLRRFFGGAWATRWFNNCSTRLKKITASLIREMPIGAPRIQVEKFVEMRGWSHVWITGEPQDAIGVTIDEYSELFISRIIVCAFWIFDKDGKLGEVHVRRVGIGPF